jgi:nucleotidyltransferase/DNA polymerase involved in DNA repair
MATGLSTAARRRCAAVLITVALATVFAACGDNDVDPEATRETVEDASQDARQAAENAFASLRTDAERLLDEIQTRNAPQVKEQLLDRCRDALERLRQANSQHVGRVDALCNRIRETDPSNARAWQDVREEVNKLRNA